MSRTMFVGDTFPDALLQISDETGVKDLSTATDIEVNWVGDSFEFSGAGTAIQPPTDDPDGEHHWNLGYPFAPGDTAEPDTYKPFVVVTWNPGEIESFPCDDTLIVKPIPTA